MSSGIKTKEEYQKYKEDIINQLKGEGDFDVQRFSEGSDFKIDYIHANNLDQKVTLLPLSLEFIEQNMERIQTIQECKHKNIARFISESIGESTYFAAFEQTEQTLKEYIDAQKEKKIDEKVFGRIASQLIDVIEYLHTKNLFLKDLSLRSILLDSKQNLKISSISKAYKLTKKEATEKFQKSENGEFEQFFYPPEYINSGEMEIEEQNVDWSVQADIWVYGMCLYALSGASPKNIIQLTQGADELQDQESLSEEYFIYLLEILQADPKERPTIETIKKSLIDIYEESPKNEMSIEDTERKQDDNMGGILGMMQGGNTGSNNNNNNKNQMSQNPFQMFNTSQSQRADFGGSAFSQGFGFPNMMQNQPIKSYKKQPEPEVTMTQEELQKPSQTFEEHLKKGTYQLNKQKQYESAIDSLKKAVELNPKSAEAYTRLSEAFKLAGKIDQGLSYYQELEKKDANNDLAIAEQGRMKYYSKMFDEAVELFNKASELNENNKYYYSFFASAYNNVNKHDFAIFYCREAQKADPHDWFAPYNLGYAYLKKKKPDVAIQFLTEAYDIESNLETNLAMGQSYYEKKDFDKALEYFNIASTKDSTSDLPFYHLGLSYQSKNNLPYAIQNFNKALEKNPNNSEAKQNLAALEQKQGKN